MYADGGFPRYYAGLGAALFQGMSPRLTLDALTVLGRPYCPLRRHGCERRHVCCSGARACCNLFGAGILALMKSNPTMKKLPVLIQTVFASLCAAAFRMILTPIDTIKTTLQTQGSEGWPLLKNRM